MSNIKKNKLKFLISKKELLVSIIIATTMTTSSYTYSANNDMVKGSAGLNAVQKKYKEDIQTARKNVNALLREIKILEDSKQYKNVEENFKKISLLLKNLGISKYVTVKLKEIKDKEVQFYEKWSNSLNEQSTRAYLNKEWGKSIKLSKESIDVLKKIKSNSKGEIVKENSIVKSAKNKLVKNKFKKEVLVNNIDLATYKQKKENIKLIQAQAEFYIKNKMFAKARNSLEQVLVLDPYDYKAMRLLKSVYRELAKVGYARSDAEIIEKMANTQWTNNQPISPEIVHGKFLSVKETGKTTVSRIRKKLNNIIIEKISFEQEPISNVVIYLNKKSKELDKEDNIGINIILKSEKSNTKKINKKPNEVLNSKSENNTKKITLELKNVPIGDVIKYICRMADLKYIVEEDAIIIGNKSIDEMVTKFFKIKSGLINSILLNIIPPPTDGFLVGANHYNPKEFGKGSNKTNEIKPEQLQKFFEERGVPFPENSRIAWNNKTSTLIATNNSNNIRILENLINDIDIEIPLILIETKFVEIKQTELEEIAFKWKFAMTGNKIGINDFTKAFTGGDTKQLGNDTLLRYLTKDGGSTTTVSEDSDIAGALVNNLTKGWSNSLDGLTNLNFWMYALDRSKTAEILSSPKIITKSGSPALIRMVRQEYFPTGWTKPEISSESKTFSVPEFGDTTDLGIRFQVTATVNPNSRSIYLDLHPQVVDQVGWESYPYDIKDILYDNRGTKLKAKLYRTNLKMARIATRDVRTNVKIYDGESVVVGGMITEQSTFVEDKYPIIGEIPLIGRLFNSKFEKVEKINLLIFVTAQLINPDGTPIRKNEKGLFDYNR